MENVTSNNVAKNGQMDLPDERSMIREQDRLARERKRRKNKRKKKIAGVVVTVLAAAGIWYAVWGRKLFLKDQETEAIVTASAGQKIVYARLDSVKGNEITYTVAQAVADTESRSDDTGQDSTDRAVHRPPDTSGSAGEPGQTAEKGRGNEAGRPDMSSNGMGLSVPETSIERGGGKGGMSSGGGFSMDGGIVMGGNKATASTDQFIYRNVTYKLTEETGALQIPVGTAVTTKLGTVTTFSRLAAGDKVALIMEQDDSGQVIAAVYIIG